MSALIHRMLKKPMTRCVMLSTKRNNNNVNITGNTKADEVLMNVTRGKIHGWLDQFNDISGFSKVLTAQQKVLDAENNLQKKQEERRNLTLHLAEVQSNLHHVTKEREMTRKGTQLYITLMTKENDQFREENDLKSKIQLLEEQGRSALDSLSTALRASQEVEKAQASQTRVFSYVMSVIGVLLGGLITGIINHIRMKRLHQIVDSSSVMVGDCKEVINQLHEHVLNQSAKTEELVLLHSTLTGNADQSKQKTTTIPVIDHKTHSIDKCTQEILDKLKSQEVMLDNEITNLKRMIGTNAAPSSGDVVYIGPEVKQMLHETEQQLEWRMKITALGTATLTYGAIVITVPLVYAIIKTISGS